MGQNILFRGHADCAVKPDSFTVQHVVLDDVLNQRRELRWLTQPLRERHLLAERLLRGFRQCAKQWRVKNSGSDGADANP
jgi:hypothetical protein